MKLLLASQSTTRRQMLEQAGVAFEMVAAPADEDAEKARLLAAGTAPRAIAAALAGLKARSADAPLDALVIGADQILETADGGVLSKARSRDEAAAQLRGLAGTTHRLHSAAVLLRNGAEIWSGTETAALTMRPLAEAFIADYLDREWAHVRWNVGCYRIEGPGVQLFERVEGSHFAILGLPLVPLLAALRAEGVLTS